MRPNLLSFSSPKKWLMLAVASTFLIACGDDGRDPILGTDGNAALSPTVTVVTPANNATGVALVNTSITAQFSEGVSTLTTSDFTVTCASPCVSPSGAVTMSDEDTTATFTVTDPAALDALTLYTATIHNATSIATGLSLEEAYIWQFTTGPTSAQTPETERPQVSATNPVTTTPGPTPGAPVNTAISAVFSEEMLASTVNDTTFTVTCEAPCVAPNGAVYYDMASQSAVFTPAEDLDWETTYTATVHSEVTDIAGNRLAGNQGAATTASDYVWEFTTGLTVDTTRPRVTVTEPVTTAPGPTTDVPVNTAITAVFSENMLPATVIDTNFTLTCETPCEAPVGEVTYVIGSKSAVFTPEQNLEEGTTYTATITSDVTDTAGNELAGNQGPVTSASDYIWMFTTVAAIPADNISVLSTDPLDAGMLAVCPNASINATFEIPSGARLNPTTVNDMTFVVVEDANPQNAVVAESIELDVDTGTIMTFIPQTQLDEDVTYRATLKGGPDGVKDLMVPGNEMLEDYVWTFTTEAATESCLQPADLKTAAPFGSFGGTAGVTNQGLLTIINGDLGTTGVSTLVTGFVSEPGCEYTITTLNEGQVNGKIFTAPPPPTVACPQDGTAITEAIATQARLDAEAAYLSLTPANMPGGQNPGNENLGSLTLAPGIYTAQSGAFSIQGGDLTLDGQGNQNAVWVFQMATTLTVGGPGADFPQSVILTNGAQAKNIFWQVGSAATINAAGGGFMKGTIIAQDGVSISTAGNVNVVTLDGRALSLGASVTVVNTVINVPAE
ncbi:MAG: Ig-like domain-containing protein [Idiomarina sp.]